MWQELLVNFLKDEELFLFEASQPYMNPSLNAVERLRENGAMEFNIIVALLILYNLI